MTLGTLLREMLKDRKQGEVAAEWQRRWTERGGKELSFDHVESSLSRCVNERLEGVRFFFGDRGRGALLLDVLGATPEQREATFASADSAMSASGERPPQIVVDLTTWVGDRDAVERLAVAIEESVLSRAPDMTVAVVLTDAQFRWLPRTFDERRGLAVERVAAAEHARPKVLEIARDAALVISSWRSDPFERWAALEFVGGRVQLGPPDALEVFGRDGRLPSLPRVLRDVATLAGVTPDAQGKAAPGGGPALRDLVVALSAPDEAGKIGPPGARLRLAQAVGVVATATPREVLDDELGRVRAKLGIPCDDSTRAEEGLQNMLERATRRTVGPAAFLFNDEIHVVAPPGALRGRTSELPHVHWHEVEQRVPALQRLQSIIARLTIDDLIADPHLEQAIAAVDKDDLDHVPLAHAAAWLLRAEEVASAPVIPEAEWRGALAALTSCAAPPASLLAASDSDWVLLSEPRLSRARAGDLGELAITPPAGKRLLVTRSDKMFYLSTRTLSKTPARLIHDVDAWQDALEQCLLSRTYQRARPDERPWDQHSGPRPTSPDVRRTWQELDRMMAGVWLALRRASGSDEAVEMHSDAILVHVGAGISIELHVRRHAAAGNGVIAAFGTRVTSTSRYPGDPVAWSPIASHVTTAGPGGSNHEPGYELPSLVYLAGKGYAAEITFAFTPWLASGSAATPAFTAVRAAIEDAEEAARRAADDDD